MNKILVLLALLASFLFIACSDPGDDNGNRDSRLVNNATNEAWIDDFPTGMRDGFILKADGKFTWIDDYPSGTWRVFMEGTWSTSNNNRLTITTNYGKETMPYVFSSDNNTVTITDEDGDWVLSRTSNIVIGGGSSGGNNNIVGTWSVDLGDCLLSTMVFNANYTGTWDLRSEDDDGYCDELDIDFTWTQSGNTIRIYVYGSYELANFQFTGGNMIIVEGIPMLRVSSAAIDKSSKTLIGKLRDLRAISETSEVSAEKIAETLKKIKSLR